MVLHLLEKTVLVFCVRNSAALFICVADCVGGSSPSLQDQQGHQKLVIFLLRNRFN